MAPVSRAVHLLGVSLFSLLNSIVSSIIVLFGLMLFTNLTLRGANLLGVLVVLAVSTVAFVGLGLFAAVFPVMSAERGAEATHIFQGSLLLVSGVYYSIDTLPRWVSHELIILALMGAIILPLGLFVFIRMEAWAKKTGKLKRTG